MRRLIKIILAILLIIIIILVVAWLRSRNTAQQRGAQPPTFRQFLGLGSATQPQKGTTPGSELTSDFTTPSDDTVTTGDTPSAGTNTSQFTSGPISPTESAGGFSGGNAPTDSKYGSGDGIPKSLPGGKNTTPAGSASAPTTTTPAAFSQCSDADLTISFTPDEIKRLNALQNRFYAIAGKLHNDADIQNETANHDQFKAKADQITELYNYCVAQSPKITNPAYTTRISTPFWRDPNRDLSGYMTNTSFLTDRTWDSGSVLVGQVAIESLFRLNLW